MSRRTDDDYHEVLLQIQALAPEMDIRKVVTDFERAIWNANHQVFIGAELAGCNFHHAQALVKNLDEHHLRNVYRSNGPVQVCLVMLPLRQNDIILTSCASIQRPPDVRLTHMLSTWCRFDVNQCLQILNNFADLYNRCINLIVIFVSGLLAADLRSSLSPWEVHCACIQPTGTTC